MPSLGRLILLNCGNLFLKLSHDFYHQNDQRVQCMPLFFFFLNSLLKRLDETLNIVLSKDSVGTKTSKTPDSKTNSSRLKFLEQTVKPGCHYAGWAWMDVSSTVGPRGCHLPPSKIRFPSLPTASLSSTANISSVLLISMKSRFDFHWREPFLFRHRPWGGPWPGCRQYSGRVSLPSHSSVSHTVWKLLANNGSIISRIVTKQD